MKLTKQEAEFILAMLNRVAVQGQEADSLVYMKNKILSEINEPRTDTKGDQVADAPTSKNGGAKSKS